MANITRNVILKLLNKYTVHEELVSLDAYVFKTLQVYGEEFADMLEEFTLLTGQAISDRNFNKILALVPSEWNTIFGSLFCKPDPKQDVLVSELIMILDEILEMEK